MSFAKAARAESLAAVQRVNLRGHFPIGLSRSWYYGAGTWLIAIAMVFLLPRRDLLGLLKEKQQQEQQIKQVEQAKAEVKQTTEAVKAVVEKLDDPALKEELKKLDGLPQAGRPEEIKREAIKTLGDLADKLKQMQGDARIDTANMMQQMLQKLHGSRDPFSQQVRMALAKGDFTRAASMLAQLQSELNAGSLPEDKRKELAAQMQELAKELAKLAEQKSLIEEELAKLGLDKQLAQASPEQLRQAMQKQGLKPEMIERLINKVKAGQAACARCSGLGQALDGAAGGGGSLSPDDLSGVIDELNSLDAMQQQALLLKASLAEVSNCTACLGQGMGGQGEWKIGPGGGQGDGIGLSTGDHAITSDPLTANKAAKAPSRTDDGPIVASWYFRDTQVKGEAQRTFAEVVQAGRASAAEALSANQIPRRYEEAVKAYFNQLEKNGPRP
ncbi:MAG: hypothetical protein NTZ17_01205 [Phycisphaerae bacterium]|nr:hypothetical protein [Phycisphaerae bacterium]